LSFWLQEIFFPSDLSWIESSAGGCRGHAFPSRRLARIEKENISVMEDRLSLSFVSHINKKLSIENERLKVQD